MELFPKTKVVVIGAGESGATAAVSLAESGHYDVTVLDRAPILPAEDAASTDINKAVRADYIDRDYAVLAQESIRRWRGKEWEGVYHETGVLQRNLTRPEAVESFAAVQSLDPEGVRKLSSSEIRARLGPGSEGSAASQQSAYYNPSGGWAWSSGAIEKLYARLRELNVPIVPSAELAESIRDGDAVVGVKSTDGREFRADKVIAALGSWTGGHPALKGSSPKGSLVPTGQTVAAVQLTPEEMEIYRDIPVNATQDGTGYYAFPPTASGVMKFASHSGGYTVPNNVPRTVLDPAAAAYAQEKGVGWIPRKSLALLREKSGEGFPASAKKELKYTRMCYYSDTPDGDFVIDYAAPGLLVASGGAGHAFKFLPVMGEIIHARLEDRSPTHLKNKWRINRPVPEAPSDDDRQGFGRQPSDLESLATTAEMGAQ